MITDPGLLILVVAVVVFAGFVKGALGFGFPLIVTPIAAILWDPQTAVVAISLPALLSNVVNIIRGGLSQAQFRRVLPALAAASVGTAIGAVGLTFLPEKPLAITLAVVTLAYVGLSLSGYEPRPPKRVEQITLPIIGVVGGILAGATNVAGPLFSMYLHSIGLTKAAFVFTLAVMFLTAGIAQVISYTALGLFTPERLTLGGAASIPMLVGLFAGFWAQNRMEQKVFNRFVLVLLLVSGVALLWNAFKA